MQSFFKKSKVYKNYMNEKEQELKENQNIIATQQEI
jgi:hypothetical protein